MDDIIAELDRIVERMGGEWAAYLIRALWPHRYGLCRQLALDAVLEDALNRGRRIPVSFENTIQSTFQSHCSASAVFRGNQARDIFEFVGNVGSGVWAVRRERALAWMARHNRSCDFCIHQAMEMPHHGSSSEASP